MNIGPASKKGLRAHILYYGEFNLMNQNRKKAPHYHAYRHWKPFNITSGSHTIRSCKTIARFLFAVHCANTFKRPKMLRDLMFHHPPHKVDNKIYVNKF